MLFVSGNFAETEREDFAGMENSMKRLITKCRKIDPDLIPLLKKRDAGAILKTLQEQMKAILFDTEIALDRNWFLLFEEKADSLLNDKVYREIKFDKTGKKKFQKKIKQVKIDEKKYFDFKLHVELEIEISYEEAEADLEDKDAEPMQIPHDADEPPPKRVKKSETLKCKAVIHEPAVTQTLWDPAIARETFGEKRFLIPHALATAVCWNNECPAERIGSEFGKQLFGPQSAETAEIRGLIAANSDTFEGSHLLMEKLAKMMTIGNPDWNIKKVINQAFLCCL